MKKAISMDTESYLKNPASIHDLKELSIISRKEHAQLDKECLFKKLQS